MALERTESLAICAVPGADDVVLGDGKDEIAFFGVFDLRERALKSSQCELSHECATTVNMDLCSPRGRTEE